LNSSNKPSRLDSRDTGKVQASQVFVATMEDQPSRADPWTNRLCEQLWAPPTKQRPVPRRSPPLWVDDRSKTTRQFTYFAVLYTAPLRHSSTASSHLSWSNRARAALLSQPQSLRRTRAVWCRRPRTKWE